MTNWFSNGQVSLDKTTILLNACVSALTPLIALSKCWPCGRMGLTDIHIADNLVHLTIKSSLFRKGPWVSVLVNLDCYNKLPHTGGLKQQTFSSLSSGGWQVQEQGTADTKSRESPLPDLQVADSLLCPHMEEERRLALLLLL